MKREFLHHQLAYLILIIALSFFTVAFLGFWPNRMAERFVVLGLSIFYIIWGVATHLKEEHLSRKIVSEYIAVSVLAGFLLVLITL